MENNNTQEKFCNFIQGFIATTSIDSHGDKLTVKCLTDMETVLKNHPEKRKMTLNHEKGNHIGEIVETKIIDEEGIKKLWVKVGIYKGKEKVLEMIKRGELKGFSWEGIFNEKDFENSKIKIEIDGKYHHEIENILENAKIKYSVHLKKSADALTVIGLLLTGIGNLIGIIGLIIALKNKNPTMNINIIINNQKIPVNKDNEEKIKHVLKSLN